MFENLREVVYVDQLPQQGVFFLAGDIGGTNSNFGILEMGNRQKSRLIISLHVKSQTVTDYTSLVADLVAYIKERYGISFYDACFGAAGIVSENRHLAKPTNLSVTLDTTAIKKASGLPHLLLINDFEAVALGIDLIDPATIITINRGKERKYAHKACIGAGTGMGKAALLWHNHFKRYLPISSEGGHGDCSGQTSQDLALFEFIKQENHGDCPISWEDVLSGNGIQRIYRFLATQEKYDETAIAEEIAATRFDPDRISRYAKQDKRCQDTFLLYGQLYARCAKNFVLDVLALNGMYIAGGIAAKNVSLFHNPLFIQEFVRCGRHSSLLEQTPVFVIADYNVSLYGAYAFMELHDQGML